MTRKTTLPTTVMLAIWQVPGLGQAKLRELLNNLPTTPGAELWKTAESLFPKLISASDKEQAEKEAIKILSACSKNSILVISALDPEYPEILREISDWPPLLFVKGSLKALKMPCAAVVGTRKAGSRGLKAAGAIASLLAKNGFCVVSGLAIGIDTAAHKATIAAGGKTIAVMGHGLDIITPLSNTGLALSILETGGALISEHPPGMPPIASEFVRRNRLQSGLSSFSVIVESGMEGGAMHQARFTVKQGKDLLVVMPEGLSRGQFNLAGARKLTVEFGAKPIVKLSDLGKYLEISAGKPKNKKASGTGVQLGFGW